MNVLVTGGGGFLGRYLVEALLAQGDRVTVLCRGQYDFLEALDIAIIRADLADKSAVQAACKGQDIVYHAAAKTGPWGDYDEFYRTNVEGTANVIDACLTAGVQTLVYTSSPSVLSFFDDLSGVDESHPFPDFRVNAYQETKMLAEQQVLAANGADNGHGGLVTTALRPHALWGPRDTQLFAVILERVKQRKLKIIGDGSNKISVSYVENAAQAHLQAARSSAVAGKAYFVNEPEPVEMWPWIAQLCEGLALPPIEKRVPYKTAYGLAWVIENLFKWVPGLGEPPMTRALVAACAKDHYFDISAAQRDFGLHSPVSMDEAMTRFWDYYRERV